VNDAGVDLQHRADQGCTFIADLVLSEQNGHEMRVIGKDCANHAHAGDGESLPFQVELATVAAK